MTTYYNDDYQEVSDEQLSTMYDDLLDEVHAWPKVGYCEVSPSEFLKEHDPIGYRTGFSDYVDSLMQDGELYEEAQLDIVTLLDAWIYGDGWLDSWEDVDPTELLYAAQHMHSTGRLEIVDGEIQPHPDYSISDIQSLITEDLA